MPSFYQGEFFRALVASGTVDLQVVFARPLSQDRVQLGWESDLQGFPYQLLPPERAATKAMELAWQQRRRIHIVNGIWAEPAFAAALAVLVSAHSRFAIYAEAPTPGINRSLIKRGARNAFGRLVCRRMSGAFPVSHFAADFLGGLGTTSIRFYPFGYFRSLSAAAGVQANQVDHQEVIFVGQLIRRKGLDLLLTAFAALAKERPSLSLTLIGVGDQADALHALACNLKIDRQVQFAGMIPARDMVQRLPSAAALVLPSRWDGWGLVVNEALSMGVPVVVSDHCGAADLIRNGYNGYVFHSEDATDLEEKLRQLLEHHDPAALRAQARAVGEAVAVENIVPYFIDCLKHMSGQVGTRPVPPWQAAVDRI